MLKRVLVITLSLVALSSMMLMAGEESAAKKGKHVDMEGTLLCMGCSLKKAEGAHAECSVYGHTHVLMIEDGKYVNFLENKYSTDLIKGGDYHNKPVKVHGVYFGDANILDVESYSVEGAAKVWCVGHKSMDGCGASK